MYDGVYKRGLAVGHSDEKSNAIVLRYKNEVYEIPAYAALDCTKYNGYFYTARIKDVRALARRLGISPYAVSEGN